MKSVKPPSLSSHTGNSEGNTRIQHAQLTSMLIQCSPLVRATDKIYAWLWGQLLPGLLLPICHFRKCFQKFSQLSRNDFTQLCTRLQLVRLKIQLVQFCIYSGTLEYWYYSVIVWRCECRIAVYWFMHGYFCHSSFCESAIWTRAPLSCISFYFPLRASDPLNITKCGITLWLSEYLALSASFLAALCAACTSEIG